MTPPTDTTPDFQIRKLALPGTLKPSVRLREDVKEGFHCSISGAFPYRLHFFLAVADFLHNLCCLPFTVSEISFLRYAERIALYQSSVVQKHSSSPIHPCSGRVWPPCFSLLDVLIDRRGRCTPLHMGVGDYHACTVLPHISPSPFHI